MKAKTNSIILSIAAITLAITPFYGIAYIIAVYFATRTIKFSKVFSTIFGRIILSLMLLGTTIMISGLIVWTIGIKVYPIIVLVLFAALLWIIKRHSKHDFSSKKFIDCGDAISIALALIAPIIIFASYQLPNPSSVASYQFAHSGWDNASHLSMLETASLENKYIYGSVADTIDKTVIRSGAYPQAWHLATANIANGFGFNPFNPKKPIQTLNLYLATVIASYIIVVYIFSITVWRILVSVVDKQRGKNIPLVIVLYSLANIFVQLVLFWGALISAFPNYLACIAYLIIMASMLLDVRKENKTTHYAVALLAGTSAALLWILPLPAAVLTISIKFLSWDYIKHLNKYKARVIKQLPIIILTVTCIAVALLQALIFVVYSHISGGNQLNVGTLGGTFSISKLMVSSVTIFSVYFWIKNKRKQGPRLEDVFTIILPIVILTVGIYAYQFITRGSLSYYFGKSAGLTFALVTIFFIPALVLQTLEIKNKNISSVLAVVLTCSILGLVIIGTDQSVASAGKLFKNKSLVSEGTAKEVVNYLSNYNPTKTKLIILRHKQNYEDRNGNLAAKIPHVPLTCAAHMVNAGDVNNLKTKINYLDECATTIDNSMEILVITSNITRGPVLNLGRKNIKIINVP